MKRQRRGSVTRAAMLLLACVLSCWRCGVEWDAPTFYATDAFALLALFTLSGFLDEIRQLIRDEIARANPWIQR